MYTGQGQDHGDGRAGDYVGRDQVPYLPLPHRGRPQQLRAAQRQVRFVFFLFFFWGGEGGWFVRWV